MTNEDLEELAYSVNDLINVLYTAPSDVVEYVASAIVNGDVIDSDKFINLFGVQEDEYDEEEE